jgi:hypothetical protein
VSLAILLDLSRENRHFGYHLLEPIQSVLLQIQSQPAVPAHGFHIVRLDARVHVEQGIKRRVRDAASREEFLPLGFGFACAFAVEHC